MQKAALLNNLRTVHHLSDRVIQTVEAHCQWTEDGWLFGRRCIPHTFRDADVRGGILHRILLLAALMEENVVDVPEAHRLKVFMMAEILIRKRENGVIVDKEPPMYYLEGEVYNDVDGLVWSTIGLLVSCILPVASTLATQ